jgi:hypothetical protein
MRSSNIHDEWLSLLEISGPFLAPPVLNDAFPQGLDLLDPSKRKRLRQAYEEWREALDSEDPEFIQLHRAWIKEVISNCLGFDEDGKGAHLMFGSSIPDPLTVQIPEHGVTLSPEYVLVDEQHDKKPLLLIQSYSSNTDLQTAMSIDGWSTTPADRMVNLCRLTGCRLGLLTNGERWMLVDAPVGAVTTFASWYARLWTQEPITLHAFVHLLGIRRFFVAASEQIPALIDKSLQHQDEVTTALGEQVQRAVEVLIQSLDRADQDRNRELLKDVTPADLYEAGLTVMMRLVFLLSAEERGLLLMGDECYEENYAISTLRMQLRSESEEILERRWDAWSRLLSVFRAVYGGIDHENMRLPALGGSLFDPDRFQFLEGRSKGSSWHQESAKPLPIDNRTVLLLLEAIQQYQGRALSYRSLDVEQIGYVYEGLLERTVKRTSEVMLDVGATRSAEKPLVSLDELEVLRQSGESALIDCLKVRSGSSVARIRNEIAKPADDQLLDRLLASCLGNVDLRNQIKPYANLLRIDPWGYPLIYPAGSFVVAMGTDRRETGSHYTPKFLTETIVEETLTPIVYIGPAEGLPRHEWRLKASDEILKLKICDPAMGSGAFLVQACRFISDRLIEAWRLAEANDHVISSEGEVVETSNFTELMPADLESRQVIARRLIAERCLYGVDLNPLAVELAKLSIWLVTLSKGRPFGFLDHNLRNGDSLVGLVNLNQLTELSITPGVGSQRRLFGETIKKFVAEAIELRGTIRKIRVNDIRDIDAIALIDAEARSKLRITSLIADAFIGVIFNAGDKNKGLESELARLAIYADKALLKDQDSLESISQMALSSLSVDKSLTRSCRPFHWALEFPEVFLPGPGIKICGFNAIIGNPPFLGGKRITSILGEKYTFGIKKIISNKKGAADLSAYFLLKAFSILTEPSSLGFVLTNSINEGDTREIGLSSICQGKGAIFYAETNRPWPGSAGVTVSVVILHKGEWDGDKILDGTSVGRINDFLSDHASNIEPLKLEKNKKFASTGTGVNGKGFILSLDEKNSFISADPKNSEVIQPYLTSQDLNQRADSSPSRYIINFGDMSEESAKKYMLPFKRVVDLVKPVRDKLTRQVHEKCFWKFWDRRDHLYDALKSLNRALVLGRVSSRHAITFMEIDWLPFDGVVVFTWDDFAHFGLMQSQIHEIWCEKFRTTLREDPRYSVSDCFLTFPLPDSNKLAQYVEKIADQYFNFRKEIMLRNNEGLTKTYNRFHNIKENDQKIIDLRNLQIEMDKAVLGSYGWSDLILDHDFHDRNKDKFTLSKPIADEILTRLLKLNIEQSQSINTAINFIDIPKVALSKSSNQQELGL